MKNQEKILVANWKTYLNSSAEIKKKLDIILKEFKNVKSLVICPPSIYLSQVQDIIKSSNIALGAQQVSINDRNIATGHVSSEMLKDIGCQYVIVGHSEVRELLHEDNTMVAKKSASAIAKKLQPIICVGESQKIRNSGEYIDFLRQQIIESLPANHCNSEFIIAYEPLWAIGTGNVPTNDEIYEVVKLIRRVSNKNILYGGSINEKNSKELARIKGLGGFLVGGASIHGNKLIRIFHNLNNTIALSS